MVAPEADGWIGILPCGVKKWVLCAGLRQERGDHCPHLSSLHTVECRSPVAALLNWRDCVGVVASVLHNNITLIIWARKSRLIFWY